MSKSLFNAFKNAFAHRTIITRIATIFSEEKADSPVLDEPAVPPHLPDPLVN
jgi:hypothetical protein